MEMLAKKLNRDDFRERFQFQHHIKEDEKKRKERKDHQINRKSTCLSFQSLTLQSS